MTSKRPRLMGRMVKVPLDCGSVVDANQTVLFVDGTADVFPVSKKIDLFDAEVKRPHADGSPMSVCYRYVSWLHPELRDSNEIHAMYSKIESWTRDGALYFFRAQEPRLPDDFVRNLSRYLEPKVVLGAAATSRTFSKLEAHECPLVTIDTLSPDVGGALHALQLSDCVAFDFQSGVPRFKYRKIIAQGPFARSAPLGKLDRSIEIVSHLVALTNDLDVSYLPILLYEDVLRDPGTDSLVNIHMRVEEMYANDRVLRDWWWEDTMMEHLAGKKLEVQRWVIDCPRSIGEPDGDSNIHALIRKLQGTSNGLVYILLDDSFEDEALDIQRFGVKRFIVNQPPNPKFQPLLEQADEVIFRVFESGSDDR